MWQHCDQRLVQYVRLYRCRQLGSWRPVRAGAHLAVPDKVCAELAAAPVAKQYGSGILIHAVQLRNINTRAVSQPHFMSNTDLVQAAAPDHESCLLSSKAAKVFWTQGKKEGSMRYKLQVGGCTLL